MSIFDKQQDLENFPDQALIQLGQQPDPQYPSYLVMAEVERRRDMRQRHEAEMAKHQAANPPDIAKQRMDELGGIAGVDPAMGEQPPPEEMAALQGGIAGGPPPGMEQMGGPPPDMGGPPPGMEGPPPMMAYGGLIPGYEHGGAYPDPDQDLYSENLPGTEDYEREGLFGPAIDFGENQLFGEGADRRRERMRMFDYVPPSERTPEYKQEQREAMEEMAMGMMPIGQTRAAGQVARSVLGPTARRVAGAVGRRLPGAAGRATRALERTSKSLDEAAKAARATVDAMRSGQPGIVAARKAAVAAEKAAATAAARLTRFPAVIERTQAISRAGREAGRGRLNRASRWGLGFPRRHPVIAGGGLGTLAYAMGDEPEESGSGLETLLRRVGSGITGGAAGARDVYEDFMPDWGDLPGGAARRTAAASGDDMLANLEEERDTYGNIAQIQAMAPIDRGGSGDLSEEEYQAAMENQRQGYARLPPGHWAEGESPWAEDEDPLIAYMRERDAEQARIRAEDRAFGERWVDRAQGATDTFLSRMQTPSPDELERREFLAEEAERETKLLARELGLSTERVDELRSEMRTEKETDHARKARLFSGLGAALMGSPRGLGSALQSTTTGLEDLDEELRIERRRDLGDVYTQRARGLGVERSGRAGIRSLREKRYADIIAKETAGEGPAYQAMMDIYGRTLASDTQRYGSRMSLEAQMLNQKLTRGQVDPGLWTEWEILFDDQIGELNDPGSIHYDADEALRMEKTKMMVGRAIADLGAANLGVGNDLGLVPETSSTSGYVP